MSTLRSLVTVVLILFASIASAGECKQPGQVGCYDLLVLNAKYDASNTLMRGIDKPYSNQEERAYRINELGPVLYKGYRAGQVQAAKARTFLVYVWGNVGSPTAYTVSGGTTTLSQAEDVTGKVAYPKFGASSNLGAPGKVYRIQASSIGAAIQFPWGGLDQATMLICAEDHETVYPADGKAEKKQGLWIMPQQLAILKQAGVKGSIVPFVSNM